MNESTTRRCEIPREDLWRKVTKGEAIGPKRGASKTWVKSSKTWVKSARRVLKGDGTGLGT